MQTQVLIIDDSRQICELLVTGIIRECQSAGKGLTAVLCTPEGMKLVKKIPETPGKGSLNVFVASSPQRALPVFSIPQLKELTVISDICMPSDTEVGLVGMLEGLASKGIHANIIFQSSEPQNRNYVESLLKSGKAFFIDKGTGPWRELPSAVVHRSEYFRYQSFEEFARRTRTPQATSSEQKPTKPAKPAHWWQRFFKKNEAVEKRVLRNHTGPLS